MARDTLTVRLRNKGVRHRYNLLWAALALAALAAFFIKPARQPWDLKLCLACAETLAAGESPYDREQIIEGVSFPCLYPPLAFDLYRPLAALEDAVPWWNALKVLGFAALLLLWRRLLPPGNDWWRLAFALGAFGTPFFAEYRSGNAGSLEQLALWGAFALFIAGRYAAFAVALAAVAQLKLQPVLFLGLLLLAPKPRWKDFGLGVAAFAALFGLNELLHPGLLTEYLARLGDPSAGWRFERGPNNCSVWAFIQHLLETAGGNRPLAARWASLLVLPWSCFVVAATAISARRVAVGLGSDEEKRRHAVLLATAAFALLAPRFKDYAFFMLIPAALVALESAAPLLWRAPLLVFAFLNSTKAAAERMGLGQWALTAGYFKLYAAVLVWGVLLSLAERKRPAGRAA